MPGDEAGSGIASLARIDCELGDLESAGIYAGTTAASRGKLGAGWGPENFGVAGGAELLRSSLGEAQAETLIAPGRELTLTDAVNRALGTVRQHASGSGSGFSTTLGADPAEG